MPKSIPAPWTGEIIGKLHIHEIKQKDFAKKLGMHDKYVCGVLNGHYAPKNAEQKFRTALNELIADRQEAKL